MFFSGTKKNKKSGATFLELIIVLAIVTILALAGAAAMISTSSENTLDSDKSIVLSALSKARTMALNGDESVEHGISFGHSSVLLFQGTNVDGAARDAVYNLAVSKISTVLSNATTSFYFNKVTGIPSTTGTVTLSSKGNSTVITIYGSGISQ